MKKITAWIAIMSVMSTTALANNSSWVLKKDEKGIKAYTQKLDDRANLGFRGVMVISTDIPTLVSVMKDVSGMSNWLHTCYEPLVVREVDDNTRIIHMKNSTPIVTDRDLVLEQKFNFHSNDEVSITLKGMPKETNEVDGFVRIPYFEGSWHFKKLADGVEVTYEGVIDPGGYIPAMLTNMMVVSTPYETLYKLNKVIKNL